MGLQLAVSPSVLTPGLYLIANLLAGNSNPGTAAQKAIVFAPSSTAGTLTQDTEIRAIGSVDDAKLAWGTKTPGYLAAVQFFKENPTGLLFGIAPTRSAGVAASATWTFASTPASSRTVRFTIAGRTLDVAWATSETADSLKARAITAINARDDLAVTAASGGIGIITASFPVAGPWGNDVLWRIELIDGSGGTINGAGLATGNLAGGTTEPDFSVALTTISGTKFDFYLGCVSNADAQSALTTSNPGRIKTQINGLNTGLNAKLEQSIFGVTSTLAPAKTGAVGRNEPTMEYLFCQNGRSLPSEWGGAWLGARMRIVAIDPAANRIATALTGCIGAQDLVADTPSQAVSEDALSNGLSIVSYDAQGTPLVVRSVTTHSQDASGNPDRRALDTSGIDGTYAVGNDLEVALPLEFPQAKISKDQPAGEEPLPDGVIEERDVKAFLILRLRFWQRRGVVRKDKLDEAIANGTLIVKVDPVDETQVNIVLPLAIFKPLAKFSLVINKAA